jgi:hypothetical protein
MTADIGVDEPDTSVLPSQSAMRGSKAVHHFRAPQLCQTENLTLAFQKGGGTYGMLFSYYR